MTGQFLKAATSYDAATANGAVSHSTSGSSILDYFYKCGSYRQRDYSQVAGDVSSILAEDSLLGLKTVFYNRLISRKPKTLNGESTETIQKGQGNKDEFVKSLKYLESSRPELLYKNLWLVPVIGCWKDLWYDSPVSGFHHYVNTDQVYALVRNGLSSDYHRALIAKYLPQIRSRKKLTNDRLRRLNDWAKGLCEYLGWTERDYRKFKSDPNNSAHLWQRQMCANLWKDIDFNAISGKALFKLVNGKAISKHGLEKKVLKWLDSQDTVKFTGYPYELYKSARSNSNRSLVQTHTFNKQFEGLLNKAREGSSELLKKGVLCAVDTSGSMSFTVDRTSNTTALDVCVGLGIYFSALLEGHFKDHVIAFSDQSKFHKLTGKFCDRVDQMQRQGWWMGSTNFQSVIDEIVRVRQQNPSIPVEEFPQVLLVVSDMQFNPCGSYYSRTNKRDAKTNYEVSMAKLEAVGLPKMTVIWWNVSAYGKDVPNKLDDEGVVLISGFDPTIVSTLLGAEQVVDAATGEVRKPTPYEAMLQCLDQSVLNKLAV